MPAVVADAQLLPGQVTVAVIWAATVVSAVRDVARVPLPVLLALAVHTSCDRVRSAASAVARTVVGTRVYPAGDTISQKVKKTSSRLWRAMSKREYLTVTGQILFLDEYVALRSCACLVKY